MKSYPLNWNRMFCKIFLKGIFVMSYSAKDIEVLKGLQPVRRRPGMYIGSTSRQGLNHLLQEIIDNAVDEALAGYCTEIYVSLNEDGSATVVDNGRGLPVDAHPTEKISAERIIFTVLHSGGKFSGNTYKISGGLHGVGSAVVNALSKKLIVEVFRDGYLYTDTYEKGVPTTKLEKGLLPKVKLGNSEKKKTGTRVTFYPDETIFEETTKFKASAIKQRIKETCFLNPSLTIVFENKRDGKEPVTYHNPGGLSSFVKELAGDYELTSPVIDIEGESNQIQARISFAFTDSPVENIVGFTNNITNPDGGTHTTGFKSAFTRLINTYARGELGLLKEKDANLSGADTRNGMVAVVSVLHPNPQFEGQTKTKLSNSDVIKAMDEIIKEQLTVYFDRNYEVLKSITDRAIEISRQRASAKSKVNLGKMSFESNGKLAKQESSDASKCEIFIVEGDSAGGSAKKARNRKYQAILPLRGKIVNVEKAKADNVLSNAEIQTMIYAFGCGVGEGFGNDFDISKLKYDKIIIMTDADVDGDHITTLMLTFFYRYMPELITEGHVYLAMPPLYGIKQGDKITSYLYSDAELERYRKTHSKKYTVQRYKGLGEMDAAQLWETTMNPETRVLKQVSIESQAEANELTSVLMGSEVAPRRSYIIEHTDEAVLDV